MRPTRFAAMTVLVLGLVGCDSLPFVGNKAADTTATDTTPAAAAATEPAQAEVDAPALEAVPITQPDQPLQQAAAPLEDEPWTPIDTGTVYPGMSRPEVVAIWGVPEAERRAGAWTYLYFRNGCEVTCGTFDLVLLENDQVVDAVVRGEGHNYGGVSSSPWDREAEFTPPLRGGSAGPTS